MFCEDDVNSLEQMRALHCIGEHVCSTLELDEVLDRILEESLCLFKAEAGSVMLLQDGFLTIRRAKGLSDHIIKNTRVAVGEGIAGHVAQTGELLLLNGKVDGKRFPASVDRADKISSSLCAPLRWHGKVLGVLMLRRSSDCVFTPDQANLLGALASQVTVALAHARLYEAQKLRAASLALERERLANIFLAMADGVVVLDVAGKVRMHNGKAETFMGLENIEGRAITEIWPTFPLEGALGLLGSERGIFEQELHLGKGDGARILRLAMTVWEDWCEGEKAVVVLMHDVTERIQVERVKSDFVSAVSHELKTPLTTISGFLELLRDCPPDEEQRVHFLNICLDESSRLRKLIDELLTLSKLEAGRFDFRLERSRFDELAAKCVASFQARYPSFTFAFSTNEEPIFLDLDDDLITQVLVNLISNAVKYSRVGDRPLEVSVEIHAEKELVKVTVRDRGIGIPAGKLPYVFDKFYRVDNTLTRQAGGTGLGLANARYIVEGHGGKIWVTSKENEGSSFFFTLPRSFEQGITSPDHVSQA